MKDDLVRFGIAMEGSLLSAFDKVVEARGGSRSEAFRDLARAEVGRTQMRKGAEAVGTLTIIYDHHVRELNDRLTEIQHELGSQIFATTHVHLDHHRCLEVIMVRGRADQLQDVADRIIAIRGVIHGGLQLFTDVPHKPAWQRQSKAAASDEHAHDHGHTHAPKSEPKKAAPRRKA
ncbi:nickel-responsive transcriptional regulator NikR [Pendulispora rubella]|uniref:Putative nickel-responsive regulator n=1 Tax=Pendulispora rubella TaxID=2741070 RepID=A0ABZ2LH08_9BACT